MRAGVPHATIARLLGASPEVILRHYARPGEEDLQAAVDRLPPLGVVAGRPHQADTGKMDASGEERTGSAG